MNKQLITIFSIFSITCLGMVSAQESKSFLPEVKKESLTFSSEDNKFKLTFNGRIHRQTELCSLEKTTSP